LRAGSANRRKFNKREARLARALKIMRRPIFYFTALAILAVAAVVSYHTEVRHPSAAPESQASAATPAQGTSRIEGPYFSDRDRVGDRVIEAINGSRKTIDLAIYSLTEPGIAAAIEAAARRGVRIRIVADQGQAGDRHSEIPYLQQAGIPVRLSGGYRGQRSIMHDKFAVFDGRKVETGSFNWTTSADDFNYENAIFIADRAIVSRYEDEFERIWSRAR
jgi:phosphatidylserine/phosphatidylglycerophosphate/cardiolipin synthase-like enzyme